MYKRLYPYLFLLTLPAFASAQVSIREIQETAPLNKQYEYVFPVIVYPTNKKVADKINDALVEDFLDINRKDKPKSIFQAVWPATAEAMPMLSEISWETIINNKKLLCIAISAEGCGAYCEHFTRHYAFDLATGQLLSLEQLLTAEGLKRMTDSVNAHKQQLLTTTIDSLQLVTTRSTSLSEEDSAQLKDELELYQDCRDRGGIETVAGSSFYLQKGQLTVRQDRCSAHYNRALDELYEFTFTFDLIRWKPYLTPYAQKLLLPSATIKQLSTRTALRNL